MLPDKPRTANGYLDDITRRCETALLEIHRHAGTFRPHLVLVGGLVPRYLVDQAYHPPRSHVGTIDVDLGLDLAIATVRSYTSFLRRLHRIGFRRAPAKRGGLAKHSFYLPFPDGTDVVLDLLTHDYAPSKVPLLQRVQSDLSALRVPGIGLALKDPVSVTVKGRLLDGSLVEEVIRVANIAAFTVLKALAYDDRAEPKDAYDLCYCLLFHEGGPAGVAARLARHRRQPNVRKAIEVLEARFASADHDGPRSYATFLGLRGEDRARAQNEAFETIRAFLSAWGR